MGGMTPTKLTKQESIAKLMAAGMSKAQAHELVASDRVRVVSAVAYPVWHPHSMLSRALELVQSGWCQHDQARRVRMNVQPVRFGGLWTPPTAGTAGCEPDDPAAIAWSLDGAIDRAHSEAVEHDSERFRCDDALGQLVTALENHIDDREIVYWNDDPARTQADVVELCRAVLLELEDGAR